MSENAKLALFMAFMIGLIAVAAVASMANGEEGDDDVPGWVKKDAQGLDAYGGLVYVKGVKDSSPTSRIWVSPEDSVRYLDGKGFMYVEKTDGSIFGINARNITDIAVNY